MALTAVFLLALASFIISILGAMGRPLVWLAILLLSLAVMLQSMPIR